jgi:basic amino acid/polyamine antiporter, APA family
MVKRGLNLLDASMLIMGSMIGSGIFLVSPDIARQVHTPGLLILSWIVAGVITIVGALSYSELAAAMPRAGGQYIFLKEAYNKLVGFLYGWTLFAVIQTGTIAAVGIGFAKYTGVFIPAISAKNYLYSIGSFHFSTQMLLAIAVILFLTVYNFSSVKKGALLQNIFTFTKILALLALVSAGFFFGKISGKGDFSHFSPMFPDKFDFSMIGIFLSATLGALFAADAWNNITFTAGEVINPQKNLPRALIIGTGTVILIYILANIAFLYVLPIYDIQHAPEDRVATVLLEAVMGSSGAVMMAALVMVSTFGCLNGIILTGARVYYAMAKDSLFFPAAGKLNKNDVPANSLLFQGIWASALVLTGTYSDLLAYVMFAVLLFYILTISGIFILRKKQPDLERPHRIWGYPFLPISYIVLASAVCISILIYNVAYAGVGLLIVLAGIPLYYISGRFFVKKQGGADE